MIVAIKIILSFLLLRHIFFVYCIFVSSRYLLQKAENIAPKDEEPVRFLVFLPMLREQNIFEETIVYFRRFVGKTDDIFVITTQREFAENIDLTKETTPELAARLKAKFGYTHFHFDDSKGTKADQINFAVSELESRLSPSEMNEVFVLIYDADSRPQETAVESFARAIRENPKINVFHQSSCFRWVEPAGAKGLRRYLSNALSRGFALRANRFVLISEMPRLLFRAGNHGKILQFLYGYVYTHITGHGLCIRASFLNEFNMEPKKPLEDMYYSYLLNTAREKMLPVTSLDNAEVSSSVSLELELLSRWFAGPARFVEYFMNERVPKNGRSLAISFSAAAITIEWLLNIAFWPFLVAALLFGEPSITILSLAVILLYVFQAVATERTYARKHASSPYTFDFDAVLALPVVTTIFGLAGWIGVVKMISGRAGEGKSER